MFLFLDSIESLSSLQPLKKLENIRFKDNTYNYSNPGNLFRVYLKTTMWMEKSKSGNSQ